MTWTIRAGGPADVPAVLALLDAAGEWLVSRGRTGQWGTARQSTSPRRLRQAESWGRDGGLWLIELDGVPLGALVLGEVPAQLPPATVPEVYVLLLVTSREHAGLGIGARLLDHAAGLAAERGATRLRLDCYGGDDRALVGYYERQGFTPAELVEFPLPTGVLWPCQVLVREL
ncbi:GCN5 family N-acetyltransferase [Longispora fulva]|uniref:GNAT superfamily N-acetyltransferase n=1 Tax=Longispora fulva TaxID=619741 RepID=A0A8J7GSX1_9ACTN|nr:GNAT family N-acetyltransferase [Longispora fulva]MBG6137728.1 GNAT superfamily N-acetyltransferase [Longispora fulva]GIG62116.1 GCN5 family N-acetyltransferase [Longispora fulva]